MVEYTVGKRPLVSICCTAYNHEPYIRECLAGFVMQKTNFPLEVLVCDDASTDRTADIIREYAEKYPEVIKPVYQTVNQYALGKNIWAELQFPYAQGKYIAVCEGDDFWLDTEKLQKQVDFLEMNPDYSECFTGFKIYNEFEKKTASAKIPQAEFTVDRRTALEKILRCDTPFQTCTIVFRNESYLSVKENYAADCQGAPMWDFQLFFHLAAVGKVKFLKEETTCYRVHADSASSYHNGEKQRKFIEKCAAKMSAIAEKYGFKQVIPQIKSGVEKKVYSLQKTTGNE